VKKKYDVALVVGTRPNFVKAAPLLKYFEENNLNTLFIHTGQHKDKNMSTDIFDDLSIRPPDIVLDTPTVNMNEQLSYMLEALDGVFNENEIKMVGVFGDVTSTLAAALSTKNKKLELFHVEAGLRSRNMEMPEERNRIIVDSISDYLFAPSYDAVENLIDENIDEDKIFSVGNIMIDTLTSNYEKIKSKTNKIKKNLNIKNEYFVTTIHRPSNLTDENLNNIFTAFQNFTQEYSVILPAHPRLKKYIDENHIELNNVALIDPLSYIDFLSLVNGSTLVLTDSGGLQEETTFMNINCLTLRNETERPITVELGTNKIVGLNTENIISEINKSLTSKLPNEIKIENWDGRTSERIYNILIKKL
tara:strand:+ start:1146 stop:2231 length:1086 start_codon:yes stop_codon:yes gene_type:complete